ncbi:MAG: ABC transporter ATP-binding protein [candidate division KSB1 bacterium]|nr:ABC transporter ATP-binding protein [candidate division KSB1 bacterium]MDZ7317652.1 ABC transporter ATP-binding protein [candidate division KSB1 bacterium]MDZ7341895.1 ABC transporter ATP-binding protein [candidate division KSB1 bacterium]
MNNNYSVDVADLTRQFGSFVAVDHISFQVRYGEIFGFLGANGAGKTTTIRMLCGLLRPTSGTGKVADFDIYTQTDNIKQNIGYMSQKFSLYEDLTVAENLEFYGGIYGLDGRQFRSARDAVIASIHLEAHLHKLTRDIPLGWKQRLALSCAIMHHPKILFLDEPTGGVDPISRREFWNLIYNLADQGTTVFVTTHYMDEAEYCNRLSIMHDGKILVMGTPQELKRRLNKTTMEEVFINLVRSKTGPQIA